MAHEDMHHAVDCVPGGFAYFLPFSRRGTAVLPS